MMLIMPCAVVQQMYNVKAMVSSTWETEANMPKLWAYAAREARGPYPEEERYYLCRRAC
jgi:hypothetical protein